MAETKKDEFDFKVEMDHLLSKKGDYSIRLRKVSWRSRPSRWEIRQWYMPDADIQKPLKGVVLDDEAVSALIEIINAGKITTQAESCE